MSHKNRLQQQEPNSANKPEKHDDDPNVPERSDEREDNPKSETNQEPEAAAEQRYFGPLLRWLRETHHIRQADSNNSAVRAQSRLMSKDVVACLRESGYYLTLPTYSEIEAGANLPRNAAGFLDAIEVCLDLQRHERRELEQALAFDILYARLGPRARYLLPQPQKATPGPLAGLSAFGVVLYECRLAAGFSHAQLAQALLNEGFTLSASEMRVLQSFRLRPVAYLTDQLGKIEQATIEEPWPLDVPIKEFIALLGRCLPPKVLAKDRLTHAAELDELARQASDQMPSL